MDALRVALHSLWNLCPLPCLPLASPLAVPSCPCETWRHLTPRIILIIYLVIKKSKQEEAAASRFGHFACFWPFSAQFSLVVVVVVVLMLKIVKFNKLPAIFIAPGPGTSIDCECFCFGFFRFFFFFDCQIYLWPVKKNFCFCRLFDHNA